MRITRLLAALVWCNLFDMFQQVNKILQLSTPVISFANSDFGYSIAKLKWEVEINHDVTSIPDLYVRIVFPFAVPTLIDVGWTPIDDICDKVRTMKYAKSATLTGDDAGAHFITMTGANFQNKGTYYMEVKYYDFPAAGFQGLLQLAVVSTVSSLNFITYGYNNDMMNMYYYAAPSASLAVSTAATSTMINYNIITKIFFALIDVTISSTKLGARLFYRLNSQTFRYDSAQTCEIIDAPGFNYYAIGTYICEFEDEVNFKGLYLSLVSGFFSSGMKIRLKVKMINPSLPGTSNLRVAYMRRYEPQILEFVTLASAFTCTNGQFKATYPRLLYGPSLDTSASTFPNLTLFTSVTSSNTIVFNSIRVDFMIDTDLPAPADYYKLVVTIGGFAKTTIPLSYIYDSMPKAYTKTRKIYSVDPTTRDITIINIGELNSLTVYSVGFKLVLEGGESLAFTGANTFCSIAVYDSSGSILVAKSAPYNVAAKAKTITTQVAPSLSNLPTIFHSILGTAPISTLSTISISQYGALKGYNNYLFIKSNIGNGFVGVAFNSYIEVFTNKLISATTYSSWGDADAASNCISVTSALVEDTAATVASCYYEYRNKGTANQEYALLRIGAKTASFFWQSGTDKYVGWRFANIPVSHSLFVNDADAAILDAYINVYANAATNYINQAYLSPVTKQYLDNIHVLNNAALSSFKIEHVNYFRSTSEQFKDDVGSAFIRVSGVLNNIDTSKAQKILLFYTQFDPMYMDNTDQYEIGCSGSAETPTRCFYKGGLVDGSRACGAGTCSDMMFREILEIHFTTSTITVSNAKSIQIIIPIKMKMGTHANINIGVGIASVHQGSYSSFDQLIEYVTFPVITLPTTTSLGTWSSLARTPAQVQLQSITKPYTWLVDTEIKGVHGTLFSSRFLIDCQTTAPKYCDVTTTGQWYSLTLCGNWNFMSDPSFDVTNVEETFDVPDIYHTCIKNITYQYIDPSSVKRTKHCMWCPFWSTGLSDQSRNFVNMKLPDYYSHRWPPGTYSLLSGTNSAFGLVTYANFQDENKDAFQAGKIKSVKVTPSVWYKDYKSMKLALSFTTNNKVRVSGTIQVVANIIMPLTFYQATNPFCYVTHKLYPGTTYGCTAVATNGLGGKITVTMLSEVPAGAITLTIYGVKIDTSITQSYGTFYVLTTTAVGTTSLYYLDQSDQEAFSVQFISHPSNAINIPDVIFVQTGDNDNKAISTLNVTVGLSNSKNLYMNDIFKLTFDATPAIANYDSTAKPFLCTVVNNLGQLLTKFKTCYAATPSALNQGVMVTSDTDTGISLFNLVLENFDLINGAPMYGATVLTYDSPTTTQTSQDMPVKQTYIAAATIQALNTFTVSKIYNYAGIRSEMVFSFKTQLETVTYTSRIVIQLHKDYDPSMIDNIHNCILTDGSGAKSSIFCYVEKDRKLEITGFASSINPMTAFSIQIAGVVQPAIKSPNELFYAQLYNADGVLKESGINQLLSPTTLASLGTGIKMITIINLSFNQSFIRSSNSLTLTFITQTTIAPNSNIYIYLDYFSYEYFILPSDGISCKLLTSANAQIQSGLCSRIGKRMLIKNSAAIAPGASTKVVIDNLVTVNYQSCDIKKISMMIVQGSTITDFAPPEYVDVQTITADLDPTLTYLNFDGMSKSAFITIKRGLYNRLNVVRMDGQRFNDELTYSLNNNFNNQFDCLNPTDIEKRDSYFGELSIPILFGSSKSTILSIFLIGVSKTETFKLGRFAPLPFLVVKTVRDKIPLPVPASLKIYRGYESLAMLLSLTDLPKEDLPITISIKTFDSGDLLKLKSLASITMSKTNIVSEIVVKYDKPITSEPVSLTTSLLELSVANDAPYTTTYVNLQVVDLVVDTSTKFRIEITDTNPYGCTSSIFVHMPLTVYYYIVPRFLYANISADYIDSQLSKGIKTDGYIKYGKMNIENSLTDYDICGGNLMANTSYVIKLYYKTFSVQNTSSSGSTTGSGTSSTGFDPLYRPNFTATATGDSADIIRIDQGSSWQIFSTDPNSAGYGYIDLTFSTTLSEQNKKDLCCYFGQALSYPLENVWTNDSYRCPSKTLPQNITYFDGIGFTKTSRRLLDDDQTVPNLIVASHKNDLSRVRMLQSASNIVRLYLMRNLRPTQDELAFNNLTSKIFATSFEAGLYSQYPAMPTISKKAPVLEVEQIASQLESFANFTANDDGKSGILKQIKLKSSGTVWSMVVLKKPNMDNMMTYQHIKLGTNPLNSTEVPVKVFKKYFASINDDYELPMPSMTLDQTYVLYYYSVSLDPNLLPAFSPIYKLEFIIRNKYRNVSFGKIILTSLLLLSTLLALLS